MQLKTQSVKNLLLLIGAILALVLMVQKTSAQNPLVEYSCPPCGCSGDTIVVHNPGNCSQCGMRMINRNNPSEGLNYINLNPAQLCQFATEHSDLVFLDVRSVGEFEQTASRLGRFKNAINIPITELHERLAELEKFKGKEILVYCSISARSPIASKLLADNGFAKIRNLMGGLSLWNNTPPQEIPCKSHLTINP